MKQTFDLADNSKAMLFTGLLSSDEDLPESSVLNLLGDYDKVSRISYKNHLPDDPGGDLFVVLIKSRYRLPPMAEIHSSDNAALNALKETTQVPVLQADDMATEFYLFDNHAGVAEDLRHDHDLVVMKNHADVIIKRFTRVGIASLQALPDNDFDYRASVNDTLWLHRPAGAGGGPLTVDWYGKGQSGRKINEQFSADDTRLTLNVDEAFVQGNNSARYLVKAGRGKLSGNERLLLLRQRVVAGKTHLASYRFRLPTPPPQARYYYYCGHGKDQPSHWCHRSVVVAIDTLEIFPDQGYLNLTWRGYWADNQLSVDQYRELKVKERAHG